MAAAPLQSGEEESASWATVAAAEGSDWPQLRALQRTGCGGRLIWSRDHLDPAHHITCDRLYWEQHTLVVTTLRLAQDELL